MTLYTSFAPADNNTRHQACAKVELAQLEGTPILICVATFRFGERWYPAGSLYCNIDGIELHRAFGRKEWAGQDADLDCELEVQTTLTHPVFCQRLLVPMAQDIAGLTRRQFAFDDRARQLAIGWLGGRPHF